MVPVSWMLPHQSSICLVLAFQFVFEVFFEVVVHVDRLRVAEAEHLEAVRGRRELVDEIFEAVEGGTVLRGDHQPAVGGDRDRDGRLL